VKSRRALALVLGAAALAPTPSRAAEKKGQHAVRARYAKYEYRVPMRDGVKLFTSVYVPRDAGRKRLYPVLLTRTPYGVAPYGDNVYPERVGPSAAAQKEGFIFAYQDVRGRYMSEGAFVDVRPYDAAKGPEDADESSDTWDTVDWLLKKLDWDNGRVGIWGISYPGFYAAMGTIDAHPALVASSPQAPIADWFIGDDFHHNGAFFLPHAFNFLSSFGKPRPEPTTKTESRFDHKTQDGYRFFLEAGPMPSYDRKYLKGEVAFWNEILSHDTYDAFWQARNTRPHLRRIRPAVLTVGGWHDAEDLFGALETYKAIERQSPETSNRLVMGPWSHGGWSHGTGESLGKVRFGRPTSRFFQEDIELGFFRAWLKDGVEPKLPEAYVFEGGRNEWRALAAWPPRDARPLALYLAAGGALEKRAPAETGESFDEYVSDPAKPVPFTEETNIGMTTEYMVDDQRFAARRPDVLVYQTAPLEEDVTLAGPITASLSVSTTGTDSDWVVKLIDVYTDDIPLGEGEWTRKNPWDQPPSRSKMAGYQQLVRGEPFRGKFRKSFERPEAFVPGHVERVEFTMPDAFHTFRKGHRIMIQVQSSWFPLVNLNPQTFVKINEASAADFRKATQRVWRTAARPSLVRLTVLP
jgi:putative CocE/NonD family hydrolase